MAERIKTRLIDDVSRGSNGLKRWRIETPSTKCGGMADVYFGHDENTGLDVAVKFLNYDLSGYWKYEDMIRKEAEAQASLRHPNIPVVYDLIEEKRGSETRIAIVTELLDYPTLGELIDKGPVKEITSLKICSQVADAADYAARKGIYHRDIKPNNILVGPDDHAYLTDWGLVGAKPDIEGDPWPGTPAYSSPERIKGMIELPDSSDEFSLATVAFESITGSLPFGNGGNTAESLGVSVLIDDFNRQKIRDLYPEDKGKKVEAIFERGLNKDYEARYQTCTEFTTELRNEILKT